MAEEEDGGGLGSADVVGGAVVTITGDTSGLEAKEKQAKGIAERVDALTATVRIGADDSELVRIVGSAERLTGGGKGFVLTPRLDEAAVLRQSQALLDKVRDQWSAGLVITPRFGTPAGGLPTVTVGGTFPPANAAGGAPLPSGGHGPGGVAVFTHAAAPALPYYPPAPRTHVPAEFTRRGIEQSLVAAYQAQGGGYTVDDDRRLEEAKGTGDPWTFHKELPGEVKRFLEQPDLRRDRGRYRRLRNLFRVTDRAGDGAGADAMGDLGEDEYFRLAELVAGSDVGPALAHARQSDDPDLQYLADLHANLPKASTAGQARRLRRKAAAASDPARRRKLLERADRLHQRAADEAEELEAVPATKLEAGHTFTAFGREHRVDLNEDDELRLTTDDGLDVPVAGLRHVVADAGSIHRRADPAGEWDAVADPFAFGDGGGGGGGEPPAVGAAAPPPPPGEPGRPGRRRTAKAGTADDVGRLRRQAAGRRAQLADLDADASASSAARERGREASIAGAEPRTGVEDQVGRLVDDLFAPAARPARDDAPLRRSAAARRAQLADWSAEASAAGAAAGRAREAEIARFEPATGVEASVDRIVDLTVGRSGRAAAVAGGRADRERYAVDRARTQAIGAGADAGHFDDQVEERVGQGAGRVQAAREVEKEYRRAAAAAKKEADAAEKAAAAAEKRAGTAQDLAAKRLSAAELDNRLAAATPREQAGILREQAESHPEGSADRMHLEARAKRIDRLVDKKEASDSEDGGRRSGGVLSTRGLMRHVSGGVLLYEGLRLASDAMQSGEATIAAGSNPRAQLAAQRAMIQSVESIPLVGQIAGLAAEGTGWGVQSRLTEAGANATDAYATQMVRADDFAHAQAQQHAMSTAPGAAARGILQSKYALRQREQEITSTYRTSLADLNAKQENEAEAKVVGELQAVGQIASGWALVHPTEYMSRVADARQGMDATYAPLRAKLKSSADQQRRDAGLDAEHEKNVVMAEQGAVDGDARAQSTYDRDQVGVAAAAGNRDPIGAFAASRAAQRKLGLQELNNQIGVASVANDQPRLASLMEQRAAQYGTVDPATGDSTVGSFDADTTAGLKGMRLQNRVEVADLTAQGTAADQLAAGQRERSALTVRTRSLEREVELLPSADNAGPEAQAKRAAGLDAINKQLVAEKSMLTGHHGGTIVAGETVGRAGAELLAGRIHAREERQEAADVDAAITRVNGGPTPAAASVAAPAAGRDGKPLTPAAAAKAAQGRAAAAYGELQAASATLRQSQAGDPGRKAKEAAVKAARAKHDAALHESRDSHAPHNGHAKVGYGLTASVELSDGKVNADGTTSVHAPSAGGMSAVLTPEMAENLRQARAARYGKLTPAERDKLAHDEAHGPVATPATDVKHAKGTYGVAAAVEFGDQHRNADGTVSVRSGTAGMSATLTAEQAANLKAASADRVGKLTPAQRDKAARDEAHGRAPRIGPAKADAPPKITGGTGGRIVADRSGAFGGGGTTRNSAAAGATGGEGSRELVSEVKTAVKMLGDFLTRTSHSPAMLRGG